MLTLDQVRERLQDRKITVVAEATGLHLQTLYDIRHGRANPVYSTVKKLSDYLAPEVQA
jgi:DNA-binding phage protein